MRYYAEISYTMDKYHPDIKCVKDWKKDKIFTYSDTYTFDNRYKGIEESCIESMKRDLRLVAGGGYNADHIHNVKFNIKRV